MDFTRLPVKTLSLGTNSLRKPAKSINEIIGASPKEIMENIIKMSKAMSPKNENLIEMCTSNPKHGVGQHFRRKTWKPGHYYTITAIKRTIEGHHGKIWGVKTILGDVEVRGGESHRVNGALKRGIWVQVSDEEFQRLNNKKIAQQKKEARVEALKKQNEQFAPKDTTEAKI